MASMPALHFAGGGAVEVDPVIAVDVKVLNAVPAEALQAMVALALRFLTDSTVRARHAIARRKPTGFSPTYGVAVSMRAEPRPRR
jgi:hypothetical protein